MSKNKPETPALTAKQRQYLEHVERCIRCAEAPGGLCSAGFTLKVEASQ